MACSCSSIMANEIELLEVKQCGGIIGDYLRAWFPEREIRENENYIWLGEDGPAWSRWDTWRMAVNLLYAWGVDDLPKAIKTIGILDEQECLTTALEAFIFAASAFAGIFDDLGLSKEDAELSRPALAAFGKAGFPFVYNDKYYFGSLYSNELSQRAGIAAEFYGLLKYLRSKRYSQRTCKQVRNLIECWYPGASTRSDGMLIAVTMNGKRRGVWSSWFEYNRGVCDNAINYAEQAAPMVYGSRKGEKFLGAIKVSKQDVAEALIFDALIAAGAFGEFHLDPNEAKLSPGARVVRKWVEQHRGHPNRQE